MLPVYLFSLVLGGGFLVLSLLSGDGGDLDVDMDVDVDADLGGDAGVDQKIFSFRGLIYALFGFGLTGALLTWMGLPTLPVALASGGAGVVSSLLVTSTFNYLKRTDSGYLPGDDTLAGTAGRVVLPLSEGSPGAVVVRRSDREIRLRALPHASGEGDPAGWSTIMVVEMEDGIARVAPLKDPQLLDS